MDINHTTKTITYEPHELLMVTNYATHCLTPKERKEWKFRLVEKKPNLSLKTSGR